MVVCWWGLGSLIWHMNIGWLVSLWKEEAGNLARILHYSWWRQWEWIWEGVHAPGCLGGLYLKNTCLLSGLSRVVLSLCLLEPEAISQHYCPSRKRRFIALNKMSTVWHILSTIKTVSWSTLFVLPGSVFLLYTGYVTPSGSRTFKPVNSTHPENGLESMPLVVPQHEDLRHPTMSPSKL